MKIARYVTLGTAATITIYLGALVLSQGQRIEASELELQARAARYNALNLKLGKLSAHLAAIESNSAEPLSPNSEHVKKRQQLVTKLAEITKSKGAPEMWNGRQAFPPKQLDPNGRPQALAPPHPQLSDELRAKKQTAKVSLSYIVDENGHVHSVEVTGSTNHAFDEVAASAISRLTFTPGIKNGARVVVRDTTFITFIDGDSPPNSSWFSP